jgi:uncharacterized repeat protein (TIGR03803 family)
MLAVAAAQAQTFTLLYQFTGGKDGASPLAGLVEDSSGNFYGTTSGGGLVGGTCKPLQGCGVVFKLDPSGKQTVLYSFTGLADGETPNSGLILDPSGTVLYGMTPGGGITGGTCTFPQGCGVVFKLDTSGSNYSVLYSFKGGTDGDGPQGSLVLDPVTGNLYGATQGGGTSMQGTIFKLDTSGVETVLYSFTGGVDGSAPLGSLVLDPAGKLLYGTTSGTVFKVDATTGAETVLDSFPGGGASLKAGVILDSAGNLYGTSSTGGALNCIDSKNHAYGCGFVFKLDPSMQEKDYSFTRGERFPVAGVVQDAVGNLYGTTQFRGTHASAGVAFEINPSLSGETVLFDFGAGGLSGIVDGLVLDTSGKVLYGTTAFAGFYGAGTVFKIDPTGPADFALTLAPAGKGSGTVTGNPPGIHCPSSCLTFFTPGTAVTLTATAAAGSSFSGWSGPSSCPGTGPCSLTTTNAGQVVFATFLLDFSLSASALTPSTVSPGGSSTSAVNVNAPNGFGSASLVCSVQPTPALAPTCSISPSSTTPATPATLTVSTTPPTAGALTSGAGTGLFYAICLPLMGVFAARVGLGSGKGRFLAAVLACILFAGVVLQVACGGGGSSSVGSVGTPAGTYTITVNGTDSTGTLKHSTTVMLNVQ